MSITFNDWNGMWTKVHFTATLRAADGSLHTVEGKAYLVSLHEVINEVRGKWNDWFDEPTMRSTHDMLDVVSVTITNLA